MKKKLIILLFLFNFFPSYTYSEIVYLDVQFILDNSDIGKYYKKKLKIDNDRTKSELDTEGAIIKKKEEEINNKKNLLKKSEIEKEIKNLNKLLIDYQSKRNKFNNKINNEKKNYSAQILKILNPLLTKYVENNNITLVIEKKNVLVGIKTLDITKNILKILNDEVEKNKLIDEN